MEYSYSEEIRCPKCNSNQLTSNQKGFGAGKAIVGAFLTGGVGLLAGFIGSKKVVITCLKCGKNFKAGEGKIVRTLIKTNYSDENYSLEKPKTFIIEAKEVLSNIEEIKSEPIVWLEEQISASRRALSTVDEIYSAPIVWSEEQISARNKKDFTPEEIEIKKENALEREKRLELLNQRIIEQKKERIVNRIVTRIILIIIFLVIAAFPLKSLFEKSLHSAFGFFFFMLFMFGSLISMGIIILIWKLTDF